MGGAESSAFQFQETQQSIAGETHMPLNSYVIYNNKHKVVPVIAINAYMGVEV